MLPEAAKETIFNVLDHDSSGEVGDCSGRWVAVQSFGVRA